MSDDKGGFPVRRIKLAAIGPAPVARRIEADAAECAALAQAFGLPGIARLTGDFQLTHERAGVIAAALRLRARLTQLCVVSLEPFEATIAETASLRFVPAASMREGEAELDPETLDGPDEIPYAGEAIDLGAVLSEQLALALDPYPRKPGARLPAEMEEGRPHPFAALGRLKDND